MEVRRQFSRIGWAFVVFCLVDVIIQVVMAVGIVLGNARGYLWVSDVNFLFLGQVSMYVFAFPVFWLMMKRIPSWKKDEGERISLGGFLLWAVVCFGYTYIGNLFGQAFMGGMEAFTGMPQENPVMDVLNQMNPWMVFLTTVVVAPVMEELMFRKFLIDRIVPFGQRAAVIVSGVAFGLFHGNFYQFFYACGLGMIFAYLYSSTGRVRYGILLHMMINMVGGMLPIAMIQGMDGFGVGMVAAMIGGMVLGLLMLGSMAGAVVLTCIYARRLTWFQGWAPVPEKGFWRSVLTAPGVVVFLVICLVLFLVN
ncbi:CPBP family intramembrane metalloprotease [Clostridiaceae bacterium]|nr:CPBP family intramembrane metalloprotease [Clostridiaceae bacterium]RKI15626.1 CPBP family intramembrane metalloprotease [bacterium 1XD21-70]